MTRKMRGHTDGGNSFYDLIDNPFDAETRLGTSGVDTVVVFEKDVSQKWADWRYATKKERAYYYAQFSSKDKN